MARLHASSPRPNNEANRHIQLAIATIIFGGRSDPGKRRSRSRRNFLGSLLGGWFGFRQIANASSKPAVGSRDERRETLANIEYAIEHYDTAIVEPKCSREDLEEFQSKLYKHIMFMENDYAFERFTAATLGNLATFELAIAIEEIELVRLLDLTMDALVKAQVSQV